MPEQSKDKLVKRARAKYLSYNLAKRLIEHNPDSYLKRSYVASTYCTSVLLQTGQKLTATYCKNRWCAVCNRIRTAILINGYEPVLSAMEEPFFVTLTKQTVEASKLPKSIELMCEVWRSILTSREGRRIKLRGVRKAECTERQNDHYHYHFHVVVEGREQAYWLVNQWLVKMGSLADEKAQDVRPADKNSLKELFKYFTKLTKIGKDGKPQLMNYERMDVIFTAMRGKRVYQPFGKVKPVSEDIEEVQAETYDFLEEYEHAWQWDVNDWINEAGECLTGYNPNEEFKALFKPKDIT